MDGTGSAPARRGTVMFVGLHHKNLRITVRELVRRGYRVRVHGSLGKPRLLSEADGVDRSPVERTIEPSRLLPRETRKLLLLMDDDCVLVVTAAGRQRAKHAILAARIRGVPVVLNHESAARWDRERASLKERMRVAFVRPLRYLQWSLHRAPSYTTCRGPGEDVRRHELVFVPHAVEPVLEGPTKLPDSPLRVLSVTQCDPGKNNDGCLRIADLCRDEPVEFTVVFSCDHHCKHCGGASVDELREAAKARGLTAVRVVPRVPDVTDLYRSHHVVIRNSTYEGANYTLVEGSAEGCIPLGSPESGGAHGYLDHGRSGYVIPATDDHAYAGVLLELLHDPERRERMRAAALEFAQARCGPGVLVDFFEQQIRAAARTHA
jgi:glycosyltransferase involved in cell wall biosynthesis